MQPTYSKAYAYFARIAITSVIVPAMFHILQPTVEFAPTLKEGFHLFKILTFLFRFLKVIFDKITKIILVDH